jgi:hypothetical protein
MSSFVHNSDTEAVCVPPCIMATYFGEVSLLGSLSCFSEESPLTSSWKASTFTGGILIPYALLQW